MFQIRELSSSASRSYRKKSTDISWWQVKTVMLAGWGSFAGPREQVWVSGGPSTIVNHVSFSRSSELKGPCKEHGAGKQRAFSALRGV